MGYCLSHISLSRHSKSDVYANPSMCLVSSVLVVPSITIYSYSSGQLIILATQAFENQSRIKSEGLHHCGLLRAVYRYIESYLQVIKAQDAINLSTDIVAEHRPCSS